MTAILGISGFYHDSAAALLVDGDVVAAAQEERFTRVRHDPSFPARAITSCLAEAGLDASDLDAVVFYEKPWLKFERILETHLAVAPAGLRSFLAAMPPWLHQKLFLPREIRRGLGDRWRGRCVFPEHHESHAASGFFPSPFDRAAILTVDGVGEWATASFGTGEGNRIDLTHELRFPHSPGLLYSAFTAFCGFRVNSGEYKLMGLAPYGQPCYADRILEHLVDLKPDGSFRLDTSYFGYCAGLTMTTRKFQRLFGGPPRRPEAPLTQREMDLAASIQRVIEEILLRMVRHVHARTGADNLCLAGGVALNCVANGRILREGPFEDLWIQPAAGDAGGALGAAWFVWHQLMGRPRSAAPGDRQRGSRLGPRLDIGATRRCLDALGAVYREIDDDELVAEVAALLADGRVVGWVQGRMEFGPRALGGRSILADARNPAMQSVLNQKVKFRESFRPFAPAVLAEHVQEWFTLDPAKESPYMLLVAPVRPDRMIGAAGDDATRGLERLRLPRSAIPAVTHVDGSARVQTVDVGRDARLHALLEAFAARTGTPLVVNTSFNVRGEPLVCSAEDAYRCFMATDIDALAIERFLLLKGAQPARPEMVAERHRGRFAPD